jgi:hypothetical protein
MKFLRAIFALTLVATLLATALQPLFAQSSGQGATGSAVGEDETCPADAAGLR